MKFEALKTPSPVLLLPKYCPIENFELMGISSPAEMFLKDPEEEL